MTGLALPSSNELLIVAAVVALAGYLAALLALAGVDFKWGRKK